MGCSAVKELCQGVVASFYWFEGVVDYHYICIHWMCICRVGNPIFGFNKREHHRPAMQRMISKNNTQFMKSFQIEMRKVNVESRNHFKHYKPETTYSGIMSTKSREKYCNQVKFKQNRRKRGKVSVEVFARCVLVSFIRRKVVRNATIK